MASSSRAFAKCCCTKSSPGVDRQHVQHGGVQHRRQRRRRGTQTIYRGGVVTGEIPEPPFLSYNFTPLAALRVPCCCTSGPALPRFQTVDHQPAAL